ncbi:FAD/NAD(P)-binding protein [Terrabacter sp. NPDC080008]|uniref:FAD/NAD(P)-binding protein n=1 Tax=Terrabacter sp. NPDC080008 TaxID=3155176 RepID=UPI00344EF190
MSPRRIVVVGGGPRALSLVERLAANATDLVAPGERVQVHVVDTHPPGGGRIWRAAQSPLLWMNSEAQDVTVFTDASVTCEGPVVDGPSLAQWAAGDEASEDAARLGPRSFAPRVVQAQYLEWAWRRTAKTLPRSLTVHVHTDRAVALEDDGPTQTVTLAGGATLAADVVVLAQGYLQQAPGPDELQLLDRAEQHDLTYVPAGHTADLDLDELRPGEPVLVRGMGLAFVDLFVLLGEGRGGRFRGTGNELTYHPSGSEPVLHVGSRRGVPYHAKLGYEVRSPADGPAPLRHLTRERLAGMGGGATVLDYRRQVWPLVVLELAVAHYRRLFHAHPERTRGTFETLERALVEAHRAGDGLPPVARPHLTDPEDLFDIDRIDRPLRADVHPHTLASEVERLVVEHVTGDLTRRADPLRSSDRAVFDTLLGVYAVLAELVVTGRLSEEDRVRHVEGHFHGLFSFLASGPPPRRLAELLALHRAGVVHFLGPDLELSVENGRFVARSGGRVVQARAAVDARLPRPDSSLVTDPLVADLLRAGELRSRPVTAADGTSLGAGQLLADARARAVRADGSVHHRRFLLGPAVSGSAGAGGFSRPGFNAPGFRQNDAVARDLLTVPISRPAAAPRLHTAPPASATTSHHPERDKDHRHAS